MEKLDFYFPASKKYQERYINQLKNVYLQYDQKIIQYEERIHGLKAQKKKILAVIKNHDKIKSK
jgi:hypothetical protein